MKIQKVFTVYFEIYGKKMKVDKQAESAFEAETRVRQDIKIHKIEDNTTKSFINDILGGFDPRK